MTMLGFAPSSSSQAATSSEKRQAAAISKLWAGTMALQVNLFPALLAVIVDPPQMRLGSQHCFAGPKHPKGSMVP